MFAVLLDATRFMWLLCYSVSVTALIYFYELARGARPARNLRKISAKPYYPEAAPKERTLVTSPVTGKTTTQAACASDSQPRAIQSDTHLAARRMQRVQSENQSVNKVHLTLSSPKPASTVQMPPSPPISPVSSPRVCTMSHGADLWSMPIEQFLNQLSDSLLDQSALMVRQRVFGIKRLYICMDYLT
ncbi:hypothetical protein BDF19DRAFT_259350 [Syncephalis fuscata]|nr:hypothetical protein BDF19DRAFT_259350 [Syncephalis fuscata]